MPVHRRKHDLQAADQRQAVVAAIPSGRPRTVQPAWTVGGIWKSRAIDAASSRNRPVHPNRSLGMGLVPWRLGRALGSPAAAASLIDQVKGAEEGFDPGDAFKFGIEPAIFLVLACLEVFEILG